MEKENSYDEILKEVDERLEDIKDITWISPRSRTPSKLEASYGITKNTKYLPTIV